MNTRGYGLSFQHPCKPGVHTLSPQLWGGRNRKGPYLGLLHTMPLARLESSGNTKTSIYFSAHPQLWSVTYQCQPLGGTADSVVDTGQPDLMVVPAPPPHHSPSGPCPAPAQDHTGGILIPFFLVSFIKSKKVSLCLIPSNIYLLEIFLFTLIFLFKLVIFQVFRATSCLD